MAGYRFDVTEYRTDRLDRLRDELWDMTAHRFALLRRLVREEPWDLLAFVEIGIDRAQHAFWQFFDPAHRSYPGPANPYHDLIPEYYAYVDRELGSLLDCIPGQPDIVVVSDHGARRRDGGFCVNQWLIEQGLLRLHDLPGRPTDLDQGMVDWTRTTAWASGGYYARIYLNVAGREPQGIVPAERRQGVLNSIGAGLAELHDDLGRPLKADVFRPEEIYRDVRGCGPDLMVILGDLTWRAVGKVGVQGLHMLANDTGPDGANHSFEGMYLCHGPRLGGGSGAGPTLPIADIFGLFTRLLDLEKPA
jgi:predicted AlkP superfamily phosphohydrolase/phosphomutase